jgi:class 3 adenylate cyclase
MSMIEREMALAAERVERRLAAILAADVAGYGRLSGVDEEGTHGQLQDHLRTLVDPKIAEHRLTPFRRPQDLARLEEALRKAGLPE